MSAAELILAATDWSENGRRAVQRAAYISRQRGAQGLLMHVAPYGLFSRVINASKSKLASHCLTRIESLARTVHDQTGFTFQTQLHAGDVATSIAKAARVSGAGLITLGRWTDSALIRWSDTPFEESVALRLLNQSASPVLIVKGDPKAPYKRVLVAIDGSDNSIAHIRQAHTLAPDAELIVVHAMDHFLTNQPGRNEAFGDRLRELRNIQHEDALNRINDLLEKCGVHKKPVVKVVEYGYAPQFILHKERDFMADLLVIGRNHRSRFRRLFFRGVTSQVLARSHCDVLVVPARGKGLMGVDGPSTSQE